MPNRDHTRFQRLGSMKLKCQVCPPLALNSPGGLLSTWSQTYVKSYLELVRHLFALRASTLQREYIWYTLGYRLELKVSVCELPFEVWSNLVNFWWWICSQMLIKQRFLGPKFGAERVGPGVSVRLSVCHRFLVRARTFVPMVIETWP